MNRRETERILEVVRRVKASGERAALATVIRVRGSAYRREGARIIVRQDGSYECLLSGGCLEPAVANAAAAVLATGAPSVACYDLAEDSIWGLGIGCSGAVDIRIERIEDDPLSQAWFAVLERAEPAVLVTALTGDGRRMLVGRDHVLGGLADRSLEAEATARARARLLAGLPQSGTDTIGSTEVFFDVSVPPPELVLFGAGHDAVPLARMAWELGFTVTVVDGREAFLGADRFPHVTLVRARGEEIARALTLSSRSSVVVMNHHLRHDRESLRFALESDASWVGVLGPLSRYQKLLAGLQAEGYAPDLAARAKVRSPVGLAVGAETPEEIAVSILGELVALQRGFDGGFLTGRTTSLHRPAENRALARS
jgi:xanthine/CO dehydrogenase XdhC/CoxF family maturation factor